MTPRASRVHLQRTTARRLLGALPDGAADAIIVDPPYPVDRHGTGHLQDWFAGTMSWRQIGAVLKLARGKLATSGVIFVMTNSAGLAEAIGAMEQAGFAKPRVITWDRQSPGLGGGLRHQTEYILVGRRSGLRTLRGSDLISVPAIGPGTAGRYPSEKPEQLGRELARIAGIRRGELVVDPFVGSGALLLGALERGAVVTGADISARAIARASARLGARPVAAATQPARPRRRPTAAARSRPGVHPRPAVPPRRARQ